MVSNREIVKIAGKDGKIFHHYGVVTVLPKHTGERWQFGTPESSEWLVLINPPLLAASDSLAAATMHAVEEEPDGYRLVTDGQEDAAAVAALNAVDLADMSKYVSTTVPTRRGLNCINLDHESGALWATTGHVSLVYSCPLTHTAEIPPAAAVAIERLKPVLGVQYSEGRITITGDGWGYSAPLSGDPLPPVRKVIPTLGRMRGEVPHYELLSAAAAFETVSASCPKISVLRDGHVFGALPTNQVACVPAAAPALSAAIYERPEGSRFMAVDGKLMAPLLRHIAKYPGTVEYSVCEESLTSAIIFEVGPMLGLIMPLRTIEDSPVTVKPAADCVALKKAEPKRPAVKKYTFDQICSALKVVDREALRVLLG